MKKRILAATLMASMALAVGYSNGTNVTVTTHEGKVVEAKTAYMPSETTGKDGSLLLLNGTRITNDFSSVHYDMMSMYKQFYTMDINDKKIYYYGQQSDVTMTASLNGNSYKMMRLQVNNSNALIGKYGLRIGTNITVNALKNVINGTPIGETNDTLQYKCGDIYVTFYLPNGKLSSVIYSF
ncbi:MAG: hypothetical protein K5769_03670 [Pseudobutyrivibrio sp.]|nr:hypothetical protein [Pseudobutyrivibrio sp.]